MHVFKYRKKFASHVSINFNVKFSDKINNKIENISTKKIKKTIIASKNSYEFFEKNTLSFIIRGEIHSIVINTCMKCKIPLFWRKYFLNIAKIRDYVNKYCNRPPYSFD